MSRTRLLPGSETCRFLILRKTTLPGGFFVYRARDYDSSQKISSRSFMDRYLFVPLSSVTPVTVDVGETVPPPVSRTLFTWHAARIIDTMTIQTQQIQNVIETLKKGADEAVSIAKLGIREADHGVQQVIEAQCALQGIRDAVERISGMSQQMAAASEEQASVAEDIARQINNVAGTVERTAKNANSAVIRGRELESTSRGLNSLVERFNR